MFFNLSLSQNGGCERGITIYFTAKLFFILHHGPFIFSANHGGELWLSAFTHFLPQSYLNARHCWPCQKMYIIRKYLVTDL